MALVPLPSMQLRFGKKSRHNYFDCLLDPTGTCCEALPCLSQHRADRCGSGKLNRSFLVLRVHGSARLLCMNCLNSAPKAPATFTTLFSTLITCSPKLAVPWMQIAESLKRFGVTEGCSSLLVARLDAASADVSPSAHMCICWF